MPIMGVDEADAVCACFFTCFCNSRNVCYIGAQFDVNGFCGHCLYGSGHFCRRFRAGAECHAAVMYVGAADIDFDDANLVFFVDAFAAVSIFVNGETADVGNDRFMEALAHFRQFFGNDFVNAGVLKPYGVIALQCILQYGG